jgi:hypothetical protein
MAQHNNHALHSMSPLAHLVKDKEENETATVARQVEQESSVSTSGPSNLLASIDSASEQVIDLCREVIEKGAANVRLHVLAIQKRKQHRTTGQSKHMRTNHSLSRAPGPNVVSNEEPAHDHIPSKRNRTGLALESMCKEKLREESSRLVRLAVLLRNYEEAMARLRADLADVLSNGDGKRDSGCQQEIPDP